MDRAQIEKVSKALADETRLTIFQAIAGRKQMNCGEIVSLQGVTPATVSHHLKILSEAGLIECCREGQFVYSKAVPATMKEYTQSLTAFVRGKSAAKAR
jgi:ArsR family transcriptional regulator